MRLQGFLNSRGSTAIGLLLSRLPLPTGYSLAQKIADRLSSQRNLPSVQAVRANQWVVYDEKPSSNELDRLVRDTFRNTAKNLYEFWHYIFNRQAIKNLVTFDSTFNSAVDQARQNRKGLIFVLPHFSNFDLVGQAAVLNGVNLHVLSYPQPPGGYRWQNKIRDIPGYKITPMSIDALRQASETLRSGGIVATGIDRPLQGQDRKYLVRFFGRYASLPAYHIRLALKNDAFISVIGGNYRSDGKFEVWASPLMEMQPEHDLSQEIVLNSERILNIIAHNIRQCTTQWAMYYPVWPEIMDQVPK